MAVPSGSFQTFQQIGRKEDVSNLIFNIDPTETPFVSNLKKATATNTRHEWQTDALTGATANARVEGDTPTYRTATPTVRLYNPCQILGYGVRVTRTARKSATYGRTDELMYQLDLRMAELKRDLEQAAVTNQAATVGAAASAATMASAESWIFTNRTTCGSNEATTPGQSGGAPITAPTDSSSAGAVTKTLMEAIVRECWNNGGKPTVVMVPALGKVKVAGFTGIATAYREIPKGKEAELVTGVDLYISNFGELLITPSRFMRTRTMLILDMKMWGLATFDPFSVEKMGKTADGDDYQIVGQYTLESRNEKASGKVSDINFSL